MAHPLLHLRKITLKECPGGDRYGFSDSCDVFDVVDESFLAEMLADILGRRRR
jgi:hypothetical protein